METTPSAVAPVSIGVVPSSTFSIHLINAILTAYVESAATIEDIANQNNVSISQVLECLHEQGPFLRTMLNTLETRVRIIAARVEAVAIETLREVATFARDQEARRKAATKLLSHFKRAVSASSHQARGAGVPPVPTSPTRAEGVHASAPKGERLAFDASSPQHSGRP